MVISRTLFPEKRRHRHARAWLRCHLFCSAPWPPPLAQQKENGRALSARRHGRTQRRRAFRRAELLSIRPTIAIPAPSRGGSECGDRSRRFLWPASQLAAIATAISEWPACDRARCRFARSHALSFRRAGFHGVGHARREIHGRWLAESRAASCAGRPLLSIPRCRFRTVFASHAFRAAPPPLPFPT